MYQTRKYVRRFDLNDDDDLEEYEAILNDPLCTVVRDIKEKLVDKLFDEESGKMTSITERLMLVVTWQKKELLL